ncbi:MAG TPA: dTDP-4-dehydrorhamnose 3,5-epimerase family protein [Thermoanaerobaculia bacterium]|nr:dTDP-4-dehydrorhamnose 3,5-epimerase family protein [Thermoanaerobaculia bacterium]
MKLIETPIAGAYIVELEPHYDERGFFARTYSDDVFGDLLPHIAQSNASFNPRRGTLRGLHYQREPHGEKKLVRCTRGAIFDVIVDLRTARWFAVELTQDNGRMVVIPEGIAHGFQTLEDASEVSYHISRAYEPQAAAGVRWNDPTLGIRWPLEVTVISERDLALPELSR